MGVHFCQNEIPYLADMLWRIVFSNRDHVIVSFIVVDLHDVKVKL
jgi:hypothetical protein